MNVSPTVKPRTRRESAGRANLLRYAMVGILILLLSGVIVLIGGRQDPAPVILASFLATMLAVSTPLVLGAL